MATHSSGGNAIIADNATILTNTNKIDSVAVSGLSGTADSLAYKVHEIEKHLHNSGQIYGLSGATMSRKSLTPIVVTGGNSDWGTELELHNGSTIESGSGTKKFDLHEMYVSAVGTANRITILEWYYGTRATGVECTFTNGTEKVNKVAHGLENGTKIMFSNSGGALPAELSTVTVYYVINKGDDDFEVSLTSGGSAVNITDDGTGTSSYHVLTQTLLTEQVVCFASTTADAAPIALLSPRIACSNRVWCRAKASGGTNAITFHHGLHDYDA